MGRHAGASSSGDARLARGQVRLPAVGRATLARIRLIAEALFSTPDGPPPLDRLDWLMDDFEDFLGHAGAQARWTIALLSIVVTILAPLFIRRLRPLHHLDRADRVAALAAMERRFGEPLVAVKALLCLVYYEHPDAAREVGFDGRCLTRASESPQP